MSTGVAEAGRPEAPSGLGREWSPGLASTRTARWPAECTGIVLALALALLAVWHMDATSRSWILYYESDTVLPALVRGSVLAGQPQDWAFSAVLFIPEMGLYFAMAALGLGIKGTFALNAVVNFLLFYASLRLLSGFVQRELTRSRRVAGALVAFGAMVSLTLLEDSPRPDTFELASLLATATYYSSTVLASVLATGIASSLVTAKSDEGRRHRIEFALVGLSSTATLTNPLFLGWEAVPLALVLALLSWRRALPWHRLIRICALLALGGVLGFAGRIPFGHLIGKDGPAYVDPQSAPWLAVYYPRMLADRTSTAAGALSLTLVVALILVSGIAFRRSLAARDLGAGIVSGMGWAAPVAVAAGAIALGAFGTRYLQPVFFAPVCALVFAPRLFDSERFARRLPRRAVWALLAGTATICLCFSAVATGALSRSAAVLDPDIRCADGWISASHRTGAGHFWTIRGPKAYLAEPDQLIQIQDPFRAFPWLTDRTDYSTRKVSFVLSDTAYPLPQLPPPAATAPHHTVSCGRYTITDFGAPILPIGAATGAKP